MTENKQSSRRQAYEEGWKAEFSRRLNKLVTLRDIDEKLLASTMECDENRVKSLLDGQDFPTVVELLRLCYLCYDADELLFGARERGFRFLLLGE